jgi:large subunit ribosomal protein L19
MTPTDNTKTKITKNYKNLLSGNLIQLVEAKFVKKTLISGNKNTLEIGDIVRIGYLIPEGGKDRTQYYEGLIIAKQNRGLGQSFTLRRSVQGVGVEQIFLVNSPKIVSITRKQSSKVRRAKLYYLRTLSGKATRLKVKL